MSLFINQIRTDGGTQSRAAISEATVADYAEQMADETTVFPPVIVYHDGSDYWLADGFHRIEAWKRIGREEVPADVRQGDRRRAILHSVAANAAHGLRRSDDDKRRAVRTLLEDEEWSQWSDREIARRVRVSPTTVAKIRAGLSVHGGQMDTERKVERGGTVYTVKTSNIGKAATEKPAQSNVDQEKPANETRAETPPEPKSQVASQENAPADPDRAVVAALSREGLEDDVIGLRAENAELKARVRKQTHEIADIKARIKELEADDKNAVIVQQAKEIRHLQREMFKAQDEARKAMAAMHRAKKRVKELEAMEVGL